MIKEEMTWDAVMFEMNRIKAVLAEYGLEPLSEPDCHLDENYTRVIGYGIHCRPIGDFDPSRPDEYGSNDYYLSMEPIDGHLQIIRLHETRGHISESKFPKLKVDTKATSWLTVAKRIKAAIDEI